MGMATCPAFGHIDEFQPGIESFSAYKERLHCFMEANEIGDGRQVAVLLSVIGTKYFSLLHSLVAPEKPKDKMLDKLLVILEAHLDPPVLIAERFWFYQRAQESVKIFVAELQTGHSLSIW